MSFYGRLKWIAKRFAKDRRGNIAIPAVLALPVLIGAAALVGEYGSGLAEKSRNQRVADLASYSGALAYAGTKSTDRMSAAAKSVAVLNGVPAADVTATLETSPKNAGSKAVYVKIRTHRNLVLSKILNSSQQLSVYAEAMSEVGGKSTPGCVLALSAAQTGVTLSGGTKIEADKCSVSSNNTVTVPCGTTITALGVNYNSTTVPSHPCTGIKGPNNTAAVIAKQATPDPLAGYAAITAAVGRIATGFSALATMVSPAAPATVTGTNIEFAYNDTTTKNQAIAMGCTATKSGSTWTLNCGTKTTVNVGTLTIGGGINLDFNVTGASNVTYNFARLVTTSATTRFGPGTFNFANGLTTAGTTSFGAGTFNFGKAFTAGGGAVTTFGAGTFNFAKGLTTGGGTTTTFGAGTFKIGRMETGCNGSTMYSICNTGTTLTFGGPSVFELYAGFMNGGGSTLNFGSGTSNSYKLGASSNGNAIELGGGSKTVMADATAANSVFQVKGHVNGGGGGSCFIIPAAAEHDIDGNFIGSGAILMGAGIYTVNGYVAFGQSGGGSATCNGQTFSVRALNVSLVISGKNVSTSGSCNGYVFCIAAGYSGIELTAPQTGAMVKLAVVGPQATAITAGATFAEGGSNAKISGAFYFPNGPIIMTGGASTMGSKTDASMCLQLIGSRITLSGGTAAASECIAAAGASGSDKVSLIR